MTKRDTRKRWLIYEPEDGITIAAVRANTKKQAIRRLVKHWQDLDPEQITPDTFESEVEAALEHYYVVPSDAPDNLTLFDSETK